MKKELVQATLNSLVYQIADILSEFKKLYPKVNDEIHTDGGMIHNKYLMQYLSNITQRTVRIADISELSAVGSAMNAMKNKVGIQSSKLYNIRMKAHSTQEYRKEWSKWIKRLS